MDLYGFTWIFVAFDGFSWIEEVLGPGCLAACAGLCRRIGSLYIKISDSGGLDLEAWCLDAWMLAGLEWIGGGDGGDGGIGMDARWEEGIGRTSHTLELQELGGFGNSAGIGNSVAGVTTIMFGFVCGFFVPHLIACLPSFTCACLVKIVGMDKLKNRFSQNLKIV